MTRFLAAFALAVGLAAQEQLRPLPDADPWGARYTADTPLLASAAVLLELGADVLTDLGLAVDDLVRSRLNEFLLVLERTPEGAPPERVRLASAAAAAMILLHPNAPAVAAARPDAIREARAFLSGRTDDLRFAKDPHDGPSPSAWRTTPTSSSRATDLEGGPTGAALAYLHCAFAAVTPSLFTESELRAWQTVHTAIALRLQFRASAPAPQLPPQHPPVEWEPFDLRSLRKAVDTDGQSAASVLVDRWLRSKNDDDGRPDGLRARWIAALRRYATTVPANDLGPVLTTDAWTANRRVAAVAAYLHLGSAHDDEPTLMNLPGTRPQPEVDAFVEPQAQLYADLEPLSAAAVELGRALGHESTSWSEGRTAGARAWSDLCKLYRRGCDLQQRGELLAGADRSELRRGAAPSIGRHLDWLPLDLGGRRVRAAGHVCVEVPVEFAGRRQLAFAVLLAVQDEQPDGTWSSPTWAR